MTNLTNINVSDEEWAFVNGTHPIYKEVIER